MVIFTITIKHLLNIDSIPTVGQHVDVNGASMFNILSFLILGTGCQTQVTQIETLLPAISISNRDVNFGEVDWGDTVYRTITVTNQGELPMGIHPMTIEGEGFENNFAIIYYPETIVCEDPTVLEVQRSRRLGPKPRTRRLPTLPRMQSKSRYRI